MDEPEAERNPRAHVASIANEEVVGADVDDAERDGRLDNPHGLRHQIQRSQRQWDAVRDSERGDDDHELPEAAAQTQETDEKQNMLRADQNVLNARGKELAHHRQSALPSARKVRDLWMTVVEDRLRQRLSVINIHEGLVCRIVWEHPRDHCDGAWRGVQGVSHVHAQRLSLRQNFNLRPLRTRLTALDLEPKARP